MPSRPPRSASPAPDFRRRLRTELPQLLREDAELRRALLELLKDVFPTRAEIDELHALREDFNRFAAEVTRRFEAVDKRFEAMDRRFDAISPS